MRSLRPAIVLIAALAVVAAPAGASLKIGLSDQHATMFANPLFAPLHPSLARYIAPYDVMKRPADKAPMIAWIAAAEAARPPVRILMAFQASQTAGHQRHVPSVAEYTSAIKAFHKAFPEIKDITPWN